MVNLNEPLPPSTAHKEYSDPRGGCSVSAAEVPQAPMLQRIAQLETEVQDLKNKLSEILTGLDNRVQRAEARIGI